MKQIPIALFLALTATSASAAELPLKGMHGTPNACVMYLAYGDGGVYDEGINPWPEGVERSPKDDFILLGPNELVGPEVSCDVVSVDNSNLRLACWNAGNEESDPVRAKLTPVDGGFDLQLGDHEPFRITPCEKPKS